MRRYKMTRRFIMPLLFVLLALFSLQSQLQFADSSGFANDGDVRKLYIGDIITLEIAAPGFSEEEMRQIFHEFEILDLAKRNKNEPYHYRLSLRSFDVGERILHIGDKEIIIEVTSTLEDIRREDIYDGGAAVVKPGFRGMQLQIMFCFAAGVFVLSGGFILYKKRRNAGIIPERAYQLFLHRAARLSTAGEGFLVELTFYFKEYLESLRNRPKRIIGKTSTEIIMELASSPFSADMLFDIQQWLAECDRLKFTGVEASIEDKNRQYEWLLRIVDAIEANRQNAAIETSA